MIRCNNCGHMNTEGSYICANCGFVVNQRSKKPIRPKMNPASANDINKKQFSENTENIGTVDERYIQQEEINQQKDNANINSNDISVQNTNYDGHMNYNGSYNPNQYYDRTAYQQQAYGVVNTGTTNNTKKVLTIASIIIAVMLGIMSMIGIKMISKVIKSKQVQVETSKEANSTKSETNNRIGSLYFSETQTIYDENNIKVTTNLADAKFDGNDLQLLLNIENNTNDNINIKIQGILVNAITGYNNCNNIVKVDSLSTKSENVLLELDKTITDKIDSVEFILYIYSDDYTTIIETDNCIIKDMTTNQPEILKAFTNKDESTQLIVDKPEENSNEAQQEEQYTETEFKIGNEKTGYINVKGNNWTEDKSSIVVDETSQNCVTNSYGASLSNNNIRKQYYVLVNTYNTDSIEEPFNQLTDVLEISHDIKYEAHNIKVVYDIMNSGGLNTITAVILDYNSNNVITFLYQEQGTKEDEFIENAETVLRSYSKCDLTDITLR